MKSDDKEKVYTVQQIAEILSTNPETVRRWIRDKKLKAVQFSKKSGNVIKESALNEFLKESPKYMSRFSVFASMVSPLAGMLSVAGAVGASIAIDNLTDKNVDTGILPNDLKEYIMQNIKQLRQTVDQKNILIDQTKNEIEMINKQISQYEYLLSNDKLIHDISESMKIKESVGNEE